MRLRQRDLKEYRVKKRVPMQDEDGTTYEGYEEIGLSIIAKVKSAGGSVAATMYGEKLKYMKTMITCDMKFNIEEHDGVCVNVGPENKPD